jgi:Bacterial HORMA domain 2
MTTVSTHNITFTRTHTATYLTEVILGTISDILAHLGITTSQFTRDWDTNETAINAWIAEGSLEQVILECHQPSGTVDPAIEFPVTYTAAGTADAQFTASRARLARFLAKLNTVPAGTTYQLFCTFTGPHTPQPGWGPGTRASTDGLRSTTFGTLGRAPYGSAGMRYLYR